MTYTVYMNKGYSTEKLLIATGSRESAMATANKYRGKGIIEVIEHTRDQGLVQIEQYLD